MFKEMNYNNHLKFLICRSSPNTQIEYEVEKKADGG